MNKKFAFGQLLIIPCMLLVAFEARAAVYETTLTLTPAEIAEAEATNLRLNLNIGAAQVTITHTGDPDYVLKAVVSYSDQDLEPTLTSTVSTTTYTATFQSGLIIGTILPGTLHSWDISIGDYDTDTLLTLNFGGVKGEADLGGAPLTGLIMDFGGDNMNVDFSQPTTRTLESMTLNCGGSYVSMTNIGNTDYTLFSMNSGGCSTSFDFNGAYSAGHHQAYMILAGSTAYCTMPLSAAEKINAYTVAAAFKLTGAGMERTVWRPSVKKVISSDYDVEDVKLDYNVTATGSILVVERTDAGLLKKNKKNKKK